MRVLTKSKRFIKSAVVGGSMFALVAAPTTALAHSSSNSDNGRSQSGRQTNNQQDRGQDKSKGPDGNKWWRDKQDRHKTCDERQAAFNQKAATYKERYTKQLNGLNIVYSGTQTYIDSGGVTVENYPTLKAEADASQANATNAVNAINAPQLDCEEDSNNQARLDSDNNNSNGNFSNSIKTAKDALHDYRQDVMKLFNAAIEA